MSVVMRPFAEVITADMIRHHFVGQDDAKGVYAKEIHIPRGTVLVSHSHEYDHLSVLAEGAIYLTVDGMTTRREAPAVLVIRKHLEHSLHALNDVVWLCIHPTEETSVEKVDDVILQKVGG